MVSILASRFKKKGNLTAPVLFALKEYPQLRGLIERKFSEVDDIARQWFVGILSGLIVIDVMLVITSVLCFPDRLGNSIFVLLIFPIILSGLGIGLTGIILGMNIGLKVGYFAGAAILLIFAVFGIGGNDLIRGLATILIFIILCLLNLKKQSWKSQLNLLASLTVGIFIGFTYFLLVGTDWFTNLDITWWTQYSKQIFSSKLIVVRTWLRSNSLSIYGGTIASASWLGYLLFYPSIDRQRKIKAYRRKEEHLIKP